ncbi:glycosyltransferase family 2 protein [Limosilactobacillus secaliphilus]|uniref:Glycosyl transferase family 2 n=1 Tax=Limosilactobacillus secaliphilus TaxID=396268 RepID=A0A0R2I773_9LACO|nr:glycosyltransferase family 2 protein [Limosilactobacillus secaliphilus]KRN58140.1 glycosyl transferase family 2 [Limosilactobacillus secaliphilus]
MKQKIAILLSTYNGYDYLEEQVQSILNQTNHDWHLYIRDDGSNDGTISLIREFAKNPLISFVNDNQPKSLGASQSFLQLLSEVDADYYMFSDQDDYWLPDKIEVSLARMKSLEETGRKAPICVHTNLKVTDDNLTPYRLYNTGSLWHDFDRLLFNNCVTGCTMMINRRLRDTVKFDKVKSSNIYMHDWWLALIAAAFGVVSYINSPTILYRQHSSNVLGSLDSKNIKGTLNSIRRVLKPSYDYEEFLKCLNMITNFNEEYGDQIDGISKRYLEEYSDLTNRSSVSHNLQLILSLPPKETSKQKQLLYDSILIRYASKLKTSN